MEYLEYEVLVPVEKAKEACDLAQEKKVPARVVDEGKRARVWVLLDSDEEGENVLEAVEFLGDLAKLIAGTDFDDQLIHVDGGMPGDSFDVFLSRGEYVEFSLTGMRNLSAVGSEARLEVRLSFSGSLGEMAGLIVPQGGERSTK